MFAGRRLPNTGFHELTSGLTRPISVGCGAGWTWVKDLRNGHLGSLCCFLTLVKCKAPHSNDPLGLEDSNNLLQMVLTNGLKLLATFAR